MIALPVPSGSTPLVTRPVSSRAHAPARPEASADAPTADDARTLDERVASTVDAALAEALAKVRTPADDEVAKQQAAFDQMMQLRAENLRETNAIREFGLAQAKKEDEIMQSFIRMIA